MLPRADVHVRDGRIEAVGPDLTAAGAEVIDATDMIVMPGFIDTHYHMWSALGRNFVGDGFGYFPAKNATSKLFTPEDFYASVMLGLVELANAGITTVHNWSHNTRTPAHADAELRAHRESMLRARYAYGHVDQMPRNEPVSFADVDRVKREYFRLRHGVRRAGASRPEPARPVAERRPDLPDRHDRRPGTQAADRAACEPGAAALRRRRGFRKARLARPQSAALPFRHRRATSTPS